MTTKELKGQVTWANDLLTDHRDRITAETSRLLFTVSSGSGVTHYYRVAVAYVNDAGAVEFDDLTWAIGRVLGYSLRDKGGRWAIAISGGGYSKPLNIAINLARFYGLDDYALKFTSN